MLLTELLLLDKLAATGRDRLIMNEICFIHLLF